MDRTGILHHTTVDSVTNHSKAPHDMTYSGFKRAHSEITGTSSRSATPQQNATFQRASSMPKETKRLTASLITSVSTNSLPQTTEYSQRRIRAATPTSTVDRSLSLSFARYGLPGLLVDNFVSLGINHIYPWQKQCLLGVGLLDGNRNLVYSAPTGGGKSLVADILMLKRVLEDRNAKALLVLPYVALVQEKVRWLRNVVQDLKRKPLDTPVNSNRLWAKRPDEDNIRVVGFFGGGKIRATWADFDIGVCTFEKANMLVNTAIDECTISGLRAVVLDELHMVNDDHRGYLMELIATKLMSLEHRVQIIGMSATISDIDLLAQWLDAHSYKTSYRPVPVEEHLVHEGNIYPAFTTGNLLKVKSQSGSRSGHLVDSNPIRTVQSSAHRELQDAALNAVVALANETARANYGVLVFCSSRQGCESIARLISCVLPSANELDDYTTERRMDLLSDLRSLPGGLDPVLADTIATGVAFHHAGLTTEERDLIANAYDGGTLKVIVATCSLAAGINLPARRVILHSARMGRDLVGPSMLRQMRGRAGRKGKDEIGETYLCCRKTDLEDIVELMHAELPQLSSGLVSDKHRIRRALLEIIAINLANSEDSILEYLQKTLLNFSDGPQIIHRSVDASLKNLLDLGFIHCDPSGVYSATQLGRAVVASSLEPDDGAFVYREMQKALQSFVLDSEMHILWHVSDYPNMCYTFTPVHDLSMATNWRVFQAEMENLDDSGLRVMTFLGLKPTTVNKMAQGGSLKESTTEERDLVRVYHRFYSALQLRDLCNEMPVHVVARKYDVPRGAVQTLAQTCQGFGAGMIKFCEQMDWRAMAAVLDHFSDRLKVGARADLLALARITFIKSRTARVFYDNGFKTIATVANADPKELLPILMQAQPTKLRLKSKDEQKYEEKLLAKAQVITDSANRLWQIEMQQDIDE
ncbi:P-loop containing nucleoside triphosphate hydrolase protein [Xylariaceae sp. FL0016]|nr:P-loop containing nucleoside triphosphate hydrolase protein [Xylariaceae sp. FL0016]